LTHLRTETYTGYILRVGRNELARQVKLCDLRDNMDLDRLPIVGQSDLRRQVRYENARRLLLSLGEIRSPRAAALEGDPK
jgi:hypothetical protein